MSDAKRPKSDLYGLVTKLIDSGRRNKLLLAAQDRCITDNTGFYPEFLKKRPEYASSIENLIRGHAEQDLPKSHFLPQKHKPIDLIDFLEVGGIISVKSDGIPAELAYFCPCPSPEYSAIIDNPLDLMVESVNGAVHSDGIIIIGWHTQPKGIGALNPQDVRYIENMTSNISPVRYTHVVYSPQKDIFSWYRLVETPKRKEPEEILVSDSYYYLTR